jgi:hypothetical protein
MVRRQLNPVHERTKQVRRFGPVVFGVQGFCQPCHLRAVMRSHVRMQQHRLFGYPLKQGFQLFAPRRDPGEIVFNLGGRDAVLDRLDQALPVSGEFAELRPCGSERSALFAAQAVEMGRVRVNRDVRAGALILRRYTTGAQGGAVRWQVVK